MARNINVKLYDDLNIDFDGFKEEYKECKELSDDEMEKVSDSDIWEWIGDTLQFYWDDLKHNIEFSSYSDCSCVVVGTLGLWYGNRNIVPIVCDDIWSAICKCVSGNGCDYTIVSQVNGHIEVSAMHHDGTNCFEIHLLNNRGIAASERIENGSGNADLSNKCYHKSINGYLF